MGNKLSVIAKNWQILLLALSLLVVANLFSGLLSLSSFEKTYTGSIISVYQDVATNLQRVIERPIRFGKPLHKFFGINALLEDIRLKHPRISQISIVLPDGTILYSTDPTQLNKLIRPELLVLEGHGTDSDGPDSLVFDDEYNILRGIRSPKKDLLGYVHIAFNQAVVQDYLTSVIKWNITKLIYTTLIVTALLLVTVVFFIDSESGRIGRKALRTLLFLFMLVGQATYAYFSILNYHDKYIDIVHIKTASINSQLEEDIEKILRAGLQINQLNKMEASLRSISAKTPYIDDISILSDSRELLYSASGTAGVSGSVQIESAPYVLEIPLQADATINGYIQTRISKSAIQDRIINIILDSLTVLLITFVFVTELLVFMSIFV